MKRPSISAIVCARNEEARLADCLALLMANKPDEIIVVDGGSTDATVEIAEAAGVRIIRSGGRGLTFDRQLGIDAARFDLIVMVDADHRPNEDMLDRLYTDLVQFNFSVVQAGVDIMPTSFWTRAEAEAMATFHHRPGPRTMIGTAPSLYRRSVFDHVRFDIGAKEMSDDADFSYRLSQVPGVRFGVGTTKVLQLHDGSWADYRAKFQWYGRRDGAFCLKHPERTASMLFHLLVRYPILRPLRALVFGRWRAPIWFWLAASTRLGAMLGVLASQKSAKRALVA